MTLRPMLGHMGHDDYDGDGDDDDGAGGGYSRESDVDGDATSVCDYHCLHSCSYCYDDHCYCLRDHRKSHVFLRCNSHLMPKRQWQ